MIAKLVVRELVAENASNLGVVPESVVPLSDLCKRVLLWIGKVNGPVCPYAQAYRLPRVLVQAQELWVLVRRKLRERAHRELVFRHYVPDSGVLG